ncbi:MAG: ATP phosphoribosyltransferase [Armatimonadota bacterium]|nr:ATP phosphoribosyltransferase [Armatimonadota bacterium]MDR7532860.1 ATP phosphoribosyltransferase [Armatimonadota bacterium]MDR7535136.1 ATP phosphoribosyltransferase [Armatimonadota bacterium]
MHESLTIAVPTGRLWRAAAALLEGLGLALDTSGRDRRLLVEFPDGVRVLAAKPADLLAYVEHGAADVGISGRDMILEQGRDVYELLDLGFGACRAVVALPEDRADVLWQPGRALRIATKYPRMTTQFFDEIGRPVEVVVLYGSVELAPLVGLADGIVDLVMTGRTLRENRLREVAVVAQSTARLVVNRASLLRPRVAAFVERVGHGVRAMEGSVRA